MLSEVHNILRLFILCQSRQPLPKGHFQPMHIYARFLLTICCFKDLTYSCDMYSYCCKSDLPTHDHSFAGQKVQFGRILLRLAGHPSPTPPTKEKKWIRWWFCMRSQCNKCWNEQKKAPSCSLSYCTVSIPSSTYSSSCLSLILDHRGTATPRVYSYQNNTWTVTNNI